MPGCAVGHYHRHRGCTGEEDLARRGWIGRVSSYNNIMGRLLFVDGGGEEGGDIAFMPSLLHSAVGSNARCGSRVNVSSRRSVEVSGRTTSEAFYGGL